EMTTGESHYFQGMRYRLVVIESGGPSAVTVRNHRAIELHVPAGTNADKRRTILNKWYREHLRAQIPTLIERWEAVVGVCVADWCIKKMKTRWATCNAAARRIWLNLELAKKSTGCLEFIVVHEMVHLLERHHNERFQRHMDEFMPSWRRYREELNLAPLAHEKWGY